MSIILRNDSKEFWYQTTNVVVVVEWLIKWIFSKLSDGNDHNFDKITQESQRKMNVVTDKCFNKRLRNFLCWMVFKLMSKIVCIHFKLLMNFQKLFCKTCYADKTLQAKLSINCTSKTRTFLCLLNIFFGIWTEGWPTSSWLQFEF